MEIDVCVPVGAHDCREVWVPEGYVRGAIDGIRVGNTEEGIAGEDLGPRKDRTPVPT